LLHLRCRRAELFNGTQVRGYAPAYARDTDVSAAYLGDINACLCIAAGLNWAPRQIVWRGLIMLAAGAAILVIALRAPDCLLARSERLLTLLSANIGILMMEGCPSGVRTWHSGGSLGWSSHRRTCGCVYLARTAAGQGSLNLIILAFFTFYAVILSFAGFRTSVACPLAVVPAAVMMGMCLPLSTELIRRAACYVWYFAFF
jgi:hypothetical protein